MQLNLPPSTEAMLRQHATAAGKVVEAFAIQVLQQQLTNEEQVKPFPRDHDDWVAALTAWSNSHPPARRNVDASRESVCEGRGL